MGFTIISRSIRKSLSITLLLTSCVAIAQPSHWRVGFQAGTANTRSEFAITPAVTNNEFNVTTPVGVWWQANIEKSVTPYLSFKLGGGRMRLPYQISAYSTLRDASGRVLSSIGGASGGGDAFTYAAVGVTANTPAWGPFIFTAGIDLNLRYNSRARSTLVYGGYGSSTMITGSDTIRTSGSYLFTPRPTSTFTLALAPQVGIDVRLSPRVFIALSTTYNLGLGYIRQATSPIELNNQFYQGRFAHRGSFLGYRAGLKYSIGKVKTMSKLQYTAYNRPEPQVPWYEQERLRTFKQGSWLVGGRVGYFSERALNGFDLTVQGQGGYFVVNQLAIGVKGQYIRDFRNSVFPITRSWLIGPWIRYHISTSRVTPFFEGSYQIGRVNFDASATNLPFPAINRTIQVLSLSGGLSMRLNQNFRLDLAAETQQFSYYPINRRTGFAPRLGLTYYIRR